MVIRSPSIRGLFSENHARYLLFPVDLLRNRSTMLAITEKSCVRLTRVVFHLAFRSDGER